MHGRARAYGAGAGPARGRLGDQRDARQAGKATRHIPTLRAAVALSESTYGPTHPNTGRLLAILSDALFEAGLEIEAEPLHHQRARDLRGSLRREDALTRDRAYWLAHHLANQHRYDEAEPLQRRVLEDMERELGPDAFDVAIALGDWQTFLRSAGRSGAAVPLVERAARITTSKVGADHMMAIDAVVKWAERFEEEGKLAEAEALLRRNLAEREAVARHRGLAGGARCLRARTLPAPATP